jgi:hypothetical protein
VPTIGKPDAPALSAVHRTKVRVPAFFVRFSLPERHLKFTRKCRGVSTYLKDPLQHRWVGELLELHQRR